jgi:hypothetical protein
MHKKKITRPSSSFASNSNYNSNPNFNKSASPKKPSTILLNLESFIPTNYSKNKSQLINNLKIVKK